MNENCVENAAAFLSNFLSVLPFFCLSVCYLATATKYFVSFSGNGVWDFCKNCPTNSSFVKIGSLTHTFTQERD
jgi:hypothetical protein